MSSISLAVVGSRTFTNYELLKDTLTKICQDMHVKQIVSGGAIGADSLARRFAIENHIPILELKPDWKKFGKAAGMLRNTDIIKQSDIVVAFWDHVSPGTRDSINKAKQMGKQCHVVKF